MECEIIFASARSLAAIKAIMTSFWLPLLTAMAMPFLWVLPTTIRAAMERPERWEYGIVMPHRWSASIWIVKVGMRTIVCKREMWILARTFTRIFFFKGHTSINPI